MNKKISKKLMGASLSILVIAATVTGCGASSKAVDVTTIKADQGEVKEYISTTGTIVPVKSSTYIGQGQVNKVNYKVGDVVNENDIIVEYSSGQKIKAGFTGTITSLNVEDDGVDTGAQPAVVLADLNNLKVQIQVGKSSASAIKKDQIVTVKNGNETFESKISFVSPTAVTTSNMSGSSTSVLVEFELGEHSKDFIAGFDLDADIMVNSVADASRVDSDAIRFIDNKPYVYVINGENKAEKKEVEIGIEANDYTEVTKGLSKGDEVIDNPSDKIEDGTSVQVKAE